MSIQNFAQEIAYSNDGIVSKQILKKKAGNVTLFAFDREQELTEHTSPFDALIQVLEGRATISIAGKAIHLNAGEAILLPANIPHAVQAPEKFKMLLTMIKSAE
ncbi:MAG: cupin domain-containing protein [Cyclobacteriaceae bacterium]